MPLLHSLYSPLFWLLLLSLGLAVSHAVRRGPSRSRGRKAVDPSSLSDPQPDGRGYGGDPQPDGRGYGLGGCARAAYRFLPLRVGQI